jgi:hypothetical protein
VGEWKAVHAEIHIGIPVLNRLFLAAFNQYLRDVLTLKMEALQSFKTSATTHPTIHHTSEEWILKIQIRRHILEYPFKDET